MFRKIIGFALIVALLIGGVALAEGASLIVKGSGTVALDADTATVVLGIQKYARDVKDAQQAVNAGMEAILAALEAAGVDEADMYTDTISIYPQYDDDFDDEEYDGDDDDEDYEEDYDEDEDYEEDEAEDRIRGYSAGSSLTIVTKDVNNVGALIDAAFDAGANTLDDVRFSASDTEAAYHEALGLAVADAVAKARIMAAAAGLELGELMSMSEGVNYDMPVMARSEALESAVAGAGTRVLASRQQVSAGVTLEYALK